MRISSFEFVQRPRWKADELSFIAGLTPIPILQIEANC